MELQEQALAEIARGDARRVERLDLPKDPLHVVFGHFDAVVEEDVVENGVDFALQVPVLVNGADDLVGDDLVGVVEVQKRELLLELLGEGLVRRHGAVAILLVPAVARLGVVAVHVVGVVEEVLHVEVLFLLGLQFVFHLLGRCVELFFLALLLLALALFEKGVFLKLILDALLQLEGVQLQQFDVLNLLRRKLLLQLLLLFEFQCGVAHGAAEGVGAASMGDVRGRRCGGGGRSAHVPCGCV